MTGKKNLLDPYWTSKFQPTYNINLGMNSVKQFYANSKNKDTSMNNNTQPKHNNNQTNRELVNNNLTGKPIEVIQENNQ